MTVRVPRKRMSFERVGSQFLSRGRFVAYRAYNCLGAAVLEPACGERDHEEDWHLQARTLSGGQDAHRIAIRCQEEGHAHAWRKAFGKTCDEECPLRNER